MKRFYDCSNSVFRPIHRGGGGPVQNDVMRYLQENSESFGFVQVLNPRYADVIITNDVFPDEILYLDKPRVKRMDGTFWDWKNHLRNIPYFEACHQANYIIFISEYAKNCFPEKLENSSVVLNWVNPYIFYPSYFQNEPKEVIAMATSWDREEKRGMSILQFAERLPEYNFKLIGKYSEWFKNLCSPNVELLGYKDNPLEIASLLRNSYCFINFSYRDPAPKVVAQASACGLPILYADSGGIGELVLEGVAVPDSDYELDIDICLERFRYLEDNVRVDIQETKNLSQNCWANMLSNYFKVMKEVI